MLASAMAILCGACLSSTLKTTSSATKASKENFTGVIRAAVVRNARRAIVEKHLNQRAAQASMLEQHGGVGAASRFWSATP